MGSANGGARGVMATGSAGLAATGTAALSISGLGGHFRMFIRLHGLILGETDPLPLYRASRLVWWSSREKLSIGTFDGLSPSPSLARDRAERSPDSRRNSASISSSWRRRIRDQVITGRASMNATPKRSRRVLTVECAAGRCPLSPALGHSAPAAAASTPTID